MTHDRLHSALDIAARQVPQPDLARAAWSRGRRVRRRHRAAAVITGASALALASGGLWLASTSRSAPEHTAPAAATTEELSLAPPADRIPPELRIWLERKVTCLDGFGVETHLDADGGLTLWARRTSPSPGLDQSSRLCDARTGLPIPLEGQFTEEQVDAIHEVYRDGWSCLDRAGLPTEPDPGREEFVRSYLTAQTDPAAPPAWNPWARVDTPAMLVTCPAPDESWVP